MRLFSKIILAMGLMISSVCLSQPDYQSSNQSALYLSLNGGIESCSGTAIGPHAILTAEHCLTDTKEMSINNVEIKPIRTDLDGDDHAIILTNSLTFKKWVHFRKNRPGVGDQVFIFGNPGRLKDLLRIGIISGYVTYLGDITPKDADTTLYDFNGFYGDSGSAIFNTKGEIVGVVSFLFHQEAEHGEQFHMMASLPLLFDPKIIKYDTNY